MRCWGANETGQLGVPSPTVDGPIDVSLPAPAEDLAAGDGHTCALAGGRLFCRGANNQSQLGPRSVPDATKPAAVDDATEVFHVAAAFFHTCADSGSELRCWGQNAWGQTGAFDGNGSHVAITPTPTVVGGLMGSLRAVAAGAYHNCAVFNEGSVQCWGSDEYGQLGDGPLPEDEGTVRPPQVAALPPVRQVAGCGHHSCAVTQAGMVYCWGRNEAGQLGDGTLEDRPSPIRVAGIEQVIAVAAGYQHTCALAQDGAVSCWGGNESGQLGDGTNTNHPTPLRLRDLPAMSLIEAHGAVFHTCAKAHSGSVWCWGNNEAGQLGDGTKERVSSPSWRRAFPELSARALASSLAARPAPPLPTDPSR